MLGALGKEVMVPRAQTAGHAVRSERVASTALRSAAKRTCGPTQPDFVARAEALLPGLRERAADAERNRRLPDVTIEEFRAAEFHKIMQPVDHGGYGLGMEVAADVVRVLATACGSSAWVAQLFMMHNWMVGLFPAAAQADYWADSEDVMCSTSSFAVKSGMDVVDGGFRLSGRWKFASGSDFADWFIILRPVPDCIDWFLVPRADLTITDDWYVSGLCATGSHDLILDNVFVPAHRVLDGAALSRGSNPGRLSIPQPAVWGIPAALVGMATGLTEAFQATLVGKRAALSGEPQVERAANQIKLAEARADLHAAELVMAHRMAQLRDNDWKNAAGNVESYHSERDAAYVARLAVKVANGLAIAAGSNATFLSNPIQRFHRDIMVGATHVSLVWEEIAELYGRALWGLPRKVRVG